MKRNEFRPRRDIREMSPRVATSHSGVSEDGDDAMVNRLQDKVCPCRQRHSSDVDLWYNMEVMVSQVKTSNSFRHLEK